MDHTPKELTLEESVAQVMQTLPPPIKKYLQSGAYTQVAQNLMKKYELHVDQGTVLEREIMLLLMGIEDPQAFSDALRNEARVSDQAIASLLQDVNAQIFIPLREQMRAYVPEAETPAQSAPQHATLATAPVQQQPRPITAPVAQPKTPPPPPPAYMPPGAPGQSFTPPKPPPSVESSRPAVPPAKAGLAAAIAQATQGAPLSPAMPAKGAPPPPNLPGALPPPTPLNTSRSEVSSEHSSNVLATPAPVREAVLNAPVAAPTPQAPARGYAMDPYREPVEGE